MNFITHPESKISLEECGKIDSPYRPNYAFSNYINDEHCYFLQCECDGICIKSDIPGWLRREDALKLYELAYYATGNILELGTYHGLSTSIIAKAVRSSNKNNIIETIELRDDISKKAKENLISKELDKHVIFHSGDAEVICKKLLSDGKKYSFIFVDHAHTYLPVHNANIILNDLLENNGLILFHDYNDSKNSEKKVAENFSEEYGVYSAVKDTIEISGYTFVGVYGCTGLFKKTV